jgi:hypothetical protein
LSKHTQTEQAASSYRQAWEWWQQRGEPLALSGLVLLACTVPLLVLLGLVPLWEGLRGMLALAWLAGMLLLPRLPRLLHQEHRRVAVLAVVGIGALAAAFALGSVQHTQAETAHIPTQASVGAQIGLQQQTQVGPSLSFKSRPRISREMFAQLLQQGTGGGGTSPAAPHADELYNIIVGYDLDPAIALAIFAQESQFCTTGICASNDMHNWGGNRRAHDPSRATGTVQSLYGPFVSYASWQDGLRDWCELIVNFYIRDRGLDTIEKAIPVYAPASDGNDPNAYIANIHRRISTWRMQDPGTLADYATHNYNVLEEGLLTETFLATGLEYNPSWAFHSYMLSEAQAGRPLGSPMDESRVITVGSEQYAIQAFALDTLYTPLAPDPNQTNWSDVRRLSDLLRAQGVPAPTRAPMPTATPVPTPTEIPVPPVFTPR